MQSRVVESTDSSIVSNYYLNYALLFLDGTYQFCHFGLMT